MVWRCDGGMCEDVKRYMWRYGIIHVLNIRFTI